MKGSANIINPRRACAARDTVLDLSVCVCFDTYSGTTGSEAAYEQYQRLQNNANLKSETTIFLKRLRSKDMP